MRFRDLPAYAQPLEAELGSKSDVPASSVCVGDRLSVLPLWER